MKKKWPMILLSLALVLSAGCGSARKNAESEGGKTSPSREYALDASSKTSSARTYAAASALTQAEAESSSEAAEEETVSPENGSESAAESAGPESSGAELDQELQQAADIALPESESPAESNGTAASETARIDENTQIVSAETLAPEPEQLSLYRITHFFGTEQDVEQYMKDRSVDGSCASIGRNRSRACIEVMATPTQAGSWVSGADQNIRDIIAAENDKSHFKIEVSEDHRVLNVLGSSNWNEKQLKSELTWVLYCMQICQVFGGTPDWSVDFRILNRKSGAMVYEAHYPQQNLDFTSEIWK